MMRSLQCNYLLCFLALPGLRAHVPILPSIMRMAGHFLVYPTRLS